MSARRCVGCGRPHRRGEDDWTIREAVDPQPGDRLFEWICLTCFVLGRAPKRVEPT